MKTLGKYEIKRELGKGAMGIVYEGFDPMIERRVAIKTILSQDADGAGMEDALARFKREAQAAGRLNHPGIVAVYEYGEDQSQADGRRVAFIAMEFVQGRELRSFFDANERFALPEIERVMSEILDALGHAHAHGVVHRDMKPANLFVLANGKIKIGDFGIARIESSDLTQVGTIMGTPAYMSPEQICGQPVDGRSDLFSCGVILYQLLTGEKPFTGNATNIVMYKVLNEMPIAPSMLNVTLPAAFDQVVKKAMAKAPDQRYQTAQEFMAAISAAAHATAANDDDQTIVQQRPSEPATVIRQADPPTVVRPRESAPVPAPAPAPVPAPMHAPTSAPVPTTARGSNKPLLMVGAVAAAVLVIGAGAYVMTRDKTPTAPGPQASAGSTASSSSSVAVASAPASSASNAANTPIATIETPTESGQIIISALGMVDSKDPRFNGDAGAAQAEARADAKRQLVEKVAALYVDSNSLDKNYPVIEKKLLSNYGSFIKNVIAEGAPRTNKDGMIEMQTSAVLKVREVQKSLNQLSKEERIDFIRNNGDPKIAIQMSIANADTAQNLASARSQLAENVLKERIKSFGFRIWSNEGDVSAGPKAKTADFQIIGEAKFKQLSMKLPASGLTINKTVLTSWTVKAIDKGSSEEIYLNTVLPKGQSWASEDLALADIGKQMGDEFSKDFFLQHFEFGVKKVKLAVAGLPDSATADLILRELQGVRQVLDVQKLADIGQYQVQMAEGSGSSDVLQDKFVRLLNAKLGQTCLAFAGSSGAEIKFSYAPACRDVATLNKLGNTLPAAVSEAPGERGKSLMKASRIST